MAAGLAVLLGGTLPGCSQNWLRPPQDWLSSRKVTSSAARADAAAPAAPAMASKPDPAAAQRFAGPNAAPTGTAAPVVTLSSPGDPATLARQVAAELYGSSSSAPPGPASAPGGTTPGTDARTMTAAGGTSAASPFADPFGDKAGGTSGPAPVTPLAVTAPPGAPVRASLSDQVGGLQTTAPPTGPETWTGLGRATPAASGAISSRYDGLAAGPVGPQAVPLDRPAPASSFGTQVGSLDVTDVGPTGPTRVSGLPVARVAAVGGSAGLGPRGPYGSAPAPGRLSAPTAVPPSGSGVTAPAKPPSYSPALEELLARPANGAAPAAPPTSPGDAPASNPDGSTYRPLSTESFLRR